MQEAADGGVARRVPEPRPVASKMLRPQQLIRLASLFTAVLAAAGSVAVDDEARDRLQDVCRGQRDVTCSCTPQHPGIDLVTQDTVLSRDGVKTITIEDCSPVKLWSDLAYGLQKLRLANVSHLVLEAPLPHKLTQLVLSGIGELESTPPHLLQALEEMEALIMQNVTFKGPNLLSGVKTNFTEITGCTFPNLTIDSLYIESRQVVVKANNFSRLDAGALTVKSENATVSDNFFGALVNGSIQWHHDPEVSESKLSFERNTIRSLGVAALSGLYHSEKSKISDNVLLCRTKEYNRCKQMAASGELTVCDAQDVCPYRERSALMRELAEMRRCNARSQLSDAECAVLVTSGADRLRSASSVATAVAVLAAILFAP